MSGQINKRDELEKSFASACKLSTEPGYRAVCENVRDQILHEVYGLTDAQVRGHMFRLILDQIGGDRE